MSVLEVRNLSKSFGGLKVIKDFSLTIEPGARHAVIGPNGAGKTTLFNMVTGWLKPDAGTIEVNGRDVAGKAPDAVTRAGLSRSFQRNALLSSLTVEQNLLIAAQAMDRSRFNPFAGNRPSDAVRERIERVATQMGLTHLFPTTAESLAYGHKRQLEVALALCSDPRVLLLDEPAAGTSIDERARLIALIRKLPRSVAVVLVEHDMDVVFETCEMITVLSYGETVAVDKPDDIRANEAVKSAYLGHEYA